MSEAKKISDYMTATEEPISRRDPVKAKTRLWSIKSEDKQEHLGCVVWDAPWRQYVFQPSADLNVFNCRCLRDLAAFLDVVNEQHRAECAGRKRCEKR